MPLTLNARKGPDTVTKLESAIARRYAEARSLSATEPLGAVYLYGYTIEMRLKCAYYRLEGIPLHHDLNLPLAGNSYSPFKLGCSEVKTILGPNPPPAVGHHLVGWASLVVDTRARNPLGAFGAAFRAQFLQYVTNASLCWSEILRYRANKPYDMELRAVTEAATWLKAKYRRLWS